MSPGLQEVVVTGDDVLDHQQPGLIRERLAGEGFGLLGQAETPQLRIGLVHEFALQRTPRHGLAPLDQFQCTADAIQRQKRKLDAAWELAPAFNATTRPSISMTGDPDEAAEVPEAACR